MQTREALKVVPYLHLRRGKSEAGLKLLKNLLKYISNDFRIFFYQLEIGGHHSRTHVSVSEFNVVFI